MIKSDKTTDIKGIIIMQKGDIREFKQILKGNLYLPKESGYDKVRMPWSRNTDPHPVLVVEPFSTQDVQAAIKFARSHSLAIAVQVTGHGAVKSSDDALLLNMRKMKGVSINSEKRTARVAAGTIWEEVVKETDSYDLAPITGTSPWVGVMGFTLGGGHGWLSGQFGFAADSIIEAELVTPEGEIMIVNKSSNPDLLWGLRGGSGNFGVVISLEFKLHPVAHAFAGSVYYAVDKAETIIKAYRDWIPNLPNTFAASLLHMQLPPIEHLPENIRGKKIIALEIFYNGNAKDAQNMLSPFYEQVGEPLQNLLKPTRYAEFILSSPQIPPTASLDIAGLQADLGDEEIGKLAKYMQESSSFTPIIEIRYLHETLRQNANNSPLRYKEARFLIFATVAITDMKEQDLKKAQSHFSDLSNTIKSYLSKRTFINFNSDTSTTAKAFLPEDYQHLVDLKTKFDPTNIFKINHNIPPKKV